MREGEKDPGLYDFRPYRGRPPLEWPDGKQVAVWISPNIEFYELDPPANPHRKSWARPHPDVVGYGHRDYGNRVGHRSEEHTSELQTLMRISYAALCLKTKINTRHQ